MATDTSAAPANAGLTVITDGDFEVMSSRESKEEMEKNLLPEKKDEVKDAASTLGKRGAEARKAKEESPDDSQEASSEAEKAPEAKQDGKKGNPRHDPRARVQQAVRERNEALERVAALEQELAQARTPQQEQKAEQKLERARLKAADLGVNLAEFEDYDEGVLTAADRLVRAHLAAYDEHRRSIESQTQAGQQDQQIREAARPHFNKWVEQNPDRAEDLQDFLESVDPSHEDIRGIVAQEILSSGEAGPLLAAHLMDHDDVRQYLRTLSPLDARVELRLIRKTLGTAAPTATAPKVRVSKAPEPVRSVAGGGPSTADNPPGDDASFEEHMAYYNARDRAGRKR